MNRAPEHVGERARRMSVGGKLSFRRRVPRVATAGLPLVDRSDDPPRLGDLVPRGQLRVDVEIGPGKGAFLAAAAAARPDTFFVGIEASPGYAAVAAASLHEQRSGNAVVVVDNASEFLRDRAPEASIDALHVYFPDPWPKRRHRGRRFFASNAPRVLHRVVKPDGLLLVATDNAAYAGEICRVVGASPLWSRDPELESTLIARGPGHAFSPTSFERKYLAEGRVIRRYAFRRVDS